MGRRKQARVMSNTYCRLLPGDVVELLYDQQGRYAYKVRGEHWHRGSPRRSGLNWQRLRDGVAMMP